MKEVIRIDGTNYLNKNAAIQRLGIDELKYRRMLKSGEIEQISTQRGDGFDEMFHRLSLNAGELKGGVFHLAHETMMTWVHLNPNTKEPQLGSDPTGYDAFVPSWLTAHIKPSWKTENNTLVCRDVEEFKQSCVVYITDLIESLRIRAAGFHTEREQILYSSYGEAAIRVMTLDDSVTWDDREMFTIEAKLRGVSAVDLVSITASKYRKYVLLNRVLSACSDVGLDKLERQQTFNEVTGAVKSIRATIRREFNSHNKT